MVENRIKEYREALGWSQEQLARKSGVSRSAVSEAESGAHVPNFGKVKKPSTCRHTVTVRQYSIKYEIDTGTKVLFIGQPDSESIFILAIRRG